MELPDLKAALSPIYTHELPTYAMKQKKAAIAAFFMVVSFPITNQLPP